MTTIRVLFALVLALAASPAAAQQTTGHITGQVVDQQGAAIRDVVVVAKNAATGFVREGVSDDNGVYRLTALPVGHYDVTAERQGFTRLERRAIVVDVAHTTTLTLTLRVAPVGQTITVTGDSPLISTVSSSVGEVVDLVRIENLPLNGRQFANLAATVPGVGLGFHADLTKSTQYTPQVSGGNGRNVIYVVDGGDNNDDTVGGLLQLYPLEAIQQFNLITHRADAEYGRSAGAVLNVVTKSGTNQARGSWFMLVRDDALNGRTFTETLTQIDTQPYRRYQFGGSAGGPLSRNKAHYFAAYERTQQDTKQAVDTLGLLRETDGIFDTPVRENLFTGKVTIMPRGGQYLAFRYSSNSNSQPTGASLRTARSAWTTSTNAYHSMNANHNWVLGRSHLNEFVFQYTTFKNQVATSSSTPYLMFPNGVTAGANPAAPQSTEQVKWQFRDDVSWAISALGGLSHDLKAGLNWIHEPRLFISTTAGSAGQYVFASNDVGGPIQQATAIGGAAAVNIPLDLYGLYVQDDWRVSNRLTLNLGLRWDYVQGMPIDQSQNPNFVALQAAGRAGRFAGTALEDFGKDPKGDTDNFQPRLGFALDVRGDGRDVVRGGWGIYTDFAYTNANALSPAIDAAGGAGFVFAAQSAMGLRKPDGTLFRASDPLSAIASLNTVNTSIPPLVGTVLSPRIQQPYTTQSSIGWSHQLDAATTVTADYVDVRGYDLNLRLRANTIVNGRRYLADLPLQPNNFNFRAAVSEGESEYRGLILGMRRRMSTRVDVSGAYTLSSSSSDLGSASDELDQNLVQDVRDPFGPVQDAPSMRTDARHRVSLAAIVQAPWQIQVSPFFLYRSALPVHSFEGLDLNADLNVNDKTSRAYRYTGVNERGLAAFEETGACDTVNCSRRAPFSQLNLRVSRSFSLWHSSKVEAIAEIFNLFDAKNPFIPLMTRRLSAAGAPLASFMQPTAFAGDFQQPEQRVGQIGFRLTF
ncbi:MAG: carboxypeptidase regulatory-like domain-containing protein [Vicinamibacterales bacterium]